MQKQPTRKRAKTKPVKRITLQETNAMLAAALKRERVLRTALKLYAANHVCDGGNRARAVLAANNRKGR